MPKSIKNKHLTSQALRFIKRNYLFIILALTTLSILLYRAGSIMPGLSLPEYKTLHTVLGLKNIYLNPLNLDLKLVQSVVFKLFNNHNLFILRLPNIILGALSAVFITVTLKLWYGNRTALMGGFLLVTSPLVIHVSRLASLDVAYLFGTSLLLLGFSLIQEKYENKIVYLITNLSIVSLIFIPGFTLLILLYFLILYKDHLEIFKTYKGKLLKGLYVLSLIVFIPILIQYLLKSRTNSLLWLIGNTSLKINILSYLKNVVLVIIHLTIRGPNNPVLWLGQAPTLDILGLCALILGTYFYVKHWNAQKSKLLFGIIVVGVLLIAYSPLISLVLLIPVIYVLIATGLSYLLQIYFKVFPTNPIARSYGIILVSIVIALSCIFGIRSYFVAWAHDPSNRSAFNIRS